MVLSKYIFLYKSVQKRVLEKKGVCFRKEISLLWKSSLNAQQHTSHPCVMTQDRVGITPPRRLVPVAL